MPTSSVISNFTSAKSYSVGSFTGVDWTNPSQALTSNAAAASSGGGGSYTKVLGLRSLEGYLQIPDSATISGIQIILVMSTVSLASGGNMTGYIDLVKATDTRVGSQKTQSIPAGSGASYTLGTSSDVWGSSLTAAEVKDSGFGVDVGFFYSGSYSVSIEQVYATIYYSYSDSTGRRGVYTTSAELRVV